MLGGVSLRFTEPHEYQERIRPAEVQMTPTSRGAFEATLAQVNLHHLTLQRGWHSLPTAIRSALHPSRISIMFHTAPAGPVMTIDSRGLDVDMFVMGMPAEEHFFQLPADTDWSTLTLTPATYAAARAVLDGDDGGSALQASIVRPSDATLGRVRNVHRRVMRLLSAPRNGGLHPEAAKAAEQALLEAVVDCLAGDAAIAEPRLGTRNSTAVMRKLYELLEAHEGFPLYTLEVCARLGVARRTLHAACAEHTGLSPHRFFLHRRMQMARQALMTADPGSATVTQIASGLGFSELGRFAVRYKWLFGESPSATLARRHG